LQINQRRGRSVPRSRNEPRRHAILFSHRRTAHQKFELSSDTSICWCRIYNNFRGLPKPRPLRPRPKPARLHLLIVINLEDNAHINKIKIINICRELSLLFTSCKKGKVFPYSCKTLGGSRRCPGRQRGRLPRIYVGVVLFCNCCYVCGCCCGWVVLGCVAPRVLL